MVRFLQSNSRHNGYRNGSAIVILKGDKTDELSSTEIENNHRRRVKKALAKSKRKKIKSKRGKHRPTSEPKL